MDIDLGAVVQEQSVSLKRTSFVTVLNNRAGDSVEGAEAHDGGGIGVGEVGAREGGVEAR